MHQFFGLSPELQEVLVNGSAQHYLQSTGRQAKDHLSRSTWTDEWNYAFTMLRHIAALALLLDTSLENAVQRRALLQQASAMIQAEQGCVLLLLFGRALQLGYVK